MTGISKKLERFLSSAQRKLIEQEQILPVKVSDGILVGDVKIINQGTTKDLWKNDVCMYKDVYLNVVAIKLANISARKNVDIRADALYRADQEYGKWFVDSQMLRTQYQKSLNNQDYDRADVLWARYCESRDRAAIAKNKAESLAQI
jgi:hypothetical protein